MYQSRQRGVVADLDDLGLTVLATDGDLPARQVNAGVPGLIGSVADTREFRQSHPGRPEHGGVAAATAPKNG